jgi:hypothetical protein
MEQAHAEAFHLQSFTPDAIERNTPCRHDRFNAAINGCIVQSIENGPKIVKSRMIERCHGRRLMLTERSRQDRSCRVLDHRLACDCAWRAKAASYWSRGFFPS